MSSMDKFHKKKHGFEAALKEIKSGKKTSHWIWYYIPTPEWPNAKQGSKNDIYALKGNEIYYFAENKKLFDNYITMVEAISDQLKKRNHKVLSTYDDNSKDQHGDLEKFLNSTKYFFKKLSKVSTDGQSINQERNPKFTIQQGIDILRQAIENAKASLNILLLFNETNLKQKLNVMQNSEGTKGEIREIKSPFSNLDDNNEDDDYEDNNYEDDNNEDDDYEDDNNEDDDYEDDDYEDDNNEDDDYDENSQPLKGSFRRCYNLKKGNNGWCAKYLGNC